MQQYQRICLVRVQVELPQLVYTSVMHQSIQLLNRTNESVRQFPPDSFTRYAVHDGCPRYRDKRAGVSYEGPDPVEVTGLAGHGNSPLETAESNQV